MPTDLDSIEYERREPESGDAAAAPDEAVPPATALPPPLPRQPAQNYFVRHWRGELSLPITYWVNGVVGGLAVGFVVAMLGGFIYRENEARPLFWLFSLGMIWLGIFLYATWQTVGVWRSATYYQQSGKSFWGAAAKVMMVLGVLQFGYRFFTAGAPQIAGIYEIVAGDSHLGPHQFHIVANGRVLEFSGGITFGVAKEMDSFLTAMENVQWVRLNSIGGRILEAQKMSDLIKARGLNTIVYKDCMSACTIAFLGGKERLLGPNGRLGFHQPAFPGLTAIDRNIWIAREEERLQKLGLSRSFAERANKAAPGSIWFPEKDELLQEHVVTRILAPSSKPATPAAAPPPSAATESQTASAVPSTSVSAPVAASSMGAGNPPPAMVPPDVIKRLNEPPRKSAQQPQHNAQ